MIAVLTLLPAKSANAANDCATYGPEIEALDNQIVNLRVGGANEDENERKLYDDLVKEKRDLINEGRTKGCKPPKGMRGTKEIIATSGTVSDPDSVPLAKGGRARTADTEYFGYSDINSLIPAFFGLAIGLIAGDDDGNSSGGAEQQLQVTAPDELADSSCGEIASEQNILTYATYCQDRIDSYTPFPLDGVTGEPVQPDDGGIN